MWLSAKKDFFVDEGGVFLKQVLPKSNFIQCYFPVVKETKIQSKENLR
jgi:hypothetical protein